MKEQEYYLELTEEKITSLWKQYQILVDLYKTYLALCISGYTFLYLVTGGATAYILQNISDKEYYIYGLLILAMIHLIFSFKSYFKTRSNINELNESINYIGKLLHIILSPHVNILSELVRFVAIFSIIISISLVVIFLKLMP